MIETKIKIDRTLETPIYKQIIEQMILLIKKGYLKSGNKIPPERELANILSTSRGTVTKAYAELERNNFIEVVQGKGSFVSMKQDILDESRKERAIRLIGDTIKELESLNFTYREISIFFDIMLMDREEQRKRIQIATIDCNPEALAIFEKQLSYISDVKIEKFFLDKDLRDKQKIIEAFDLIITTYNHYDDVKNSISGIEDKLVKAAVSPSQETIINIAKIKENKKIGIISISTKFNEIICSTLKSFNIKDRDVSSAFEKDINKDKLVSYINDKQYLIIPMYSLINEKYRDMLDEFKNSGGEIICFEYQIERGTMIFIEEKIIRMMKNKNQVN